MIESMSRQTDSQLLTSTAGYSLQLEDPYQLETSPDIAGAVMPPAPASVLSESVIRLTGSDVDANSSADIIWRNPTAGSTKLWQMDGSTVEAETALPNATGVWTPKTVGDMDGDGYGDLIWRNTANGLNSIWLMKDGQYAGATPLRQIGNVQWEIRGSGDFNDDGYTDLVWRNLATQQVSFWFMQGTEEKGQKVVNNIGSNWQIFGTGDMNSDGQTDLIWRNTVSGEGSVWLMNQSTATQYVSIPRVANLNWQIQGTADFNEDGQTDILWRQASNDRNSVWLMNGNERMGTRELTGAGNPGWEATVVARTGLADLTVEDLTVPTTVIQGDELTVGLTLANLGSRTAAASEVEIYLSSDEILDEQDTVLTTVDVAALRADESNTLEVALQSSANWATGTQYLLFATDAGATVNESDETNNLATQAITVESPVPLADLEVSVGTIPATVTAGQPFVVTATVSNNSDEVAATASTLAYYLSDDAEFSPDTDTRIGETAVDPIAVSDSFAVEQSLSFSPDLGGGQKYLFLVADDTAVIEENNETNNQVSQVISVQLPPDIDLVVNDAIVSEPISDPSSIQPTDEVVVGNGFGLSLTVANTGTESSIASRFGWYISDDAVWDETDFAVGTTRSIPVLEPAAETAITLNTFYSPAWGTGDKYVLFVADYQETVAETDEANNIAAVPLKVLAAPVQGIDLAPEEPTVSADTLIFGEPFTVSVDIRNLGGTSAPSSEVRYFLSDDEILDPDDPRIGAETTVQIGSLAFADTETASLTATYNPDWGTGSKYIIMLADGGDDVSESNESNNFVVLPVFAQSSATPRPDLLVENLVFPTTNLATGENFEFSFDITNNGEASVGSNYQLTYYVSSNNTYEEESDRLIGFVVGPTLAPGASATRSFNTTYSSSWGTGNQHILIFVDVSNSVIESNENNNIASQAIQVS